MMASASMLFLVLVFLLTMTTISLLFVSSHATAFCAQPPLAQASKKKATITRNQQQQQQQQQQEPYFDSAPNPQTTSHRILCYGDSLTAGLVTDSISNQQYFPYAPHLENALNNNQQQQQHQQLLESSSSIPAGSTSSSPKVMVRQRGIPGWTADAMSQDLDGPNTGLRSALQVLSTMPIIPGVVEENDKNSNGIVSLVIIMAGTNDIGYGYNAHDIAQNIISLHRVCFENGVARTLAIAVPPSAYQCINAQAATLVQAINQELQDYCRCNEKRTSYMAFPFDYSSTTTTTTTTTRNDGDNDNNYWSTDGLHFSARGYQALGESLAPVISAILQELENEQQ